MIQDEVLRDFCALLCEIPDEDISAAFDRLDALTGPDGELYRQETIASSAVGLVAGMNDDV